MNEPGEKDRDAPAPWDRGGEQAESGQAGLGEDSLIRGLKTILESQCVDPNVVVQLLAGRLSAIECRLARADRCMDRMKRRVTQVEAHLTGLLSRTSEHEEALQMMCLVLKDLDDPYGFGTSLDERIAYDEPDRAEEEGL